MLLMSIFMSEHTVIAQLLQSLAVGKEQMVLGLAGVRRASGTV